MKQLDPISGNILSALKSGEEQAFKEVYEHFSGQLYGNLLKMVKSKDLAGGLLQDIFLKIWEKRHTIDINKSFEAYIFRIAENMVYDFYRKAAREKKLQQFLIARATEILNENSEEKLKTQEYSLLLKHAIETLPPRRQQIFRLCKLEGKSYEEVASQLHISQSTISDHIVKAMKAIRNYCQMHSEALSAIYLFFFLTLL